MSVKLRSLLRNVHLHFWWEEPSGVEPIAFRDPLAARSFLSRLVAEGHGSALHRLAADRFSASQRDDAAVLDWLASLVVAGRLRIAASPVGRLTTWGDEGEAEAAAEAPRAAPPPDEAPAPADEPLPPAPTDMIVQASALKRAAQQGAPFCEECERRKRAQAAAR